MRRYLIVVWLALLLPVPQLADAALLVGHWDFEEDSGNDVFDQSTFGNNGQLTGATRSPGKVGQGLNFFGAGGVTIPHSPSLDTLPSGFTFSAWIKPTGNAGDYTTLFSKSPNPLAPNPADVKAQLHIRLDGQTGQLQFVTNNHAQLFGGFEGFTALGVVPDDEWSFLAWTYDEAMERIYVNGEEIFSAPFTQPWVGSLEPLKIGHGASAIDYFGMMDEPRVYRGALTRDEILLDMTGSVVPEPGSLLLLGFGLLCGVLLKEARRRVGQTCQNLI